MENSPEKFKYQQYFDKLRTPCPPEDFAARETIAFRWVFEDMNDGRNFLPQYIKNPKRFNEKPDHIKCQALGLSFYDSLENAKGQFNRIKKIMGGDAFNLGVNIAEGIIKPNYGVMDVPNQRGHTALHLFEKVAIESCFEIISPL